ncbi:MAG: bifunctional phosphoribosyl-AMP cyclohydrolase/phosphoribosyl-ATP diphosphatase HisIE [Myxococcales bacterium]|nr:bifunctional phosphoribosyl-AMP cyclohydrolase/phosphoribosyl-ATP diphosphatase HisIE [Myxococcales bacterium]
MDSLRWDDHGLVTVVVQDRLTGEVRMLAHANRAAVEATLASGQAHFYSRSRRSLWRKGETSGNTIAVSSLWADCDGDALIYLSEPAGPSCHTGRTTCFFRRVAADGQAVDEDPGHARALFPHLWSELVARKAAEHTRSYTRTLLDSGPARLGDKVREEAGEFDQAIRAESSERVVSEAADVIYHLLVGLLSREVDLRAVQGELARRFGVSGLVEKASRKPV